MTLWDYFADGEWQFNHSVLGASEDDAPTPRFKSQKWWASKTWRKRIVPTDRAARIAPVEQSGSTGRDA